jgi:trehalose 6-phosphate phosphatase
MTVITFDLAKDALFLDLDGTLIDIAPRPDDVHAPKELIAVLGMLYQRLGGALAVVSGRPIATIDALLAPLRLPASGVHGSEIRRDASDSITLHPARIISPAVRWLLAPLYSIPGVLIEDKGIAIAVHYRQALDAAELIRETVVNAVRADEDKNLTLIPGKCVYEIKQAGYSKGTALAEFMAVSPWNGRRPVFVGDDITDEQAFAVLPRWDGLGLAVGEERIGAVKVFLSAAEVRNWLSRLVHQEYTT